MLSTLISLVAVVRLLTFSRQAQSRRPWAQLLAWLLIVAFTVLAVDSLYPVPHPLAAIAEGLISTVLALALLAVKGNVVELFRLQAVTQPSCLLVWLRRETWFK